MRGKLGKRSKVMDNAKQKTKKHFSLKALLANIQVLKILIKKKNPTNVQLGNTNCLFNNESNGTTLVDWRCLHELPEFSYTQKCTSF